MTDIIRGRNRQSAEKCNILEARVFSWFAKLACTWVQYPSTRGLHSMLKIGEQYVVVLVVRRGNKLPTSMTKSQKIGPSVATRWECAEVAID